MRITGPSVREATTGAKGKAKLTVPLPGDYWLIADFLGTSVAYQCFHIARQSSGPAKHTLKYEWGDHTNATRRIAGNILDIQSGTGGTPLWNASHYVKVPVAAADLILKNSFTDQIFTTKSGGNGTFAFASIPKGIYVVQIKGGVTGQPLELTAFPVAVNPNSRNSHLVITRSTGSDCGGSLILLEATP